MFDTFPEDYFSLSRQIKLRQVDGYLVQLAIASNPNKSPEDAQDFVDRLIRQRNAIGGDDEVADQLDVAAFELMRKQLSTESNLVKARVIN